MQDHEIKKILWDNLREYERTWKYMREHKITKVNITEHSVVTFK